MRAKVVMEETLCGLMALNGVLRDHPFDVPPYLPPMLASLKLALNGVLREHPFDVPPYVPPVFAFCKHLADILCDLTGVLCCLTGGNGFYQRRCAADAWGRDFFDSNCALMVAAGVVPVLAAPLSLWRYAGFDDACELACAALCNIAHSSGLAAYAAGAVPAVVALLGAGGAGMKAASETLCAIAHDCTGLVTCVVAGAVPAIAAALSVSAAAGDTVGCAAACKALNSMARSSAGSLACEAAALALLSSHDGNAGNPANAKAGAEAMCALTGGREAVKERFSDPWGEDYDARCRRLVHAGAVPALVATLREYAGAADVCEWACAALCNIACSGGTFSECSAAADAAPAVVAVLPITAGGAGSVMACEALWGFAHSDEGTAKCLAAGAVPAATAALAASAAAGASVGGAAACMAMGSMARSAEGGRACAAAVVALLLSHEGDAGVCKAACSAFCSIVIEAQGDRLMKDERRAACVAAGAVPAVAAALASHTVRATRALAPAALGTHAATLAAAAQPMSPPTFLDAPAAIKPADLSAVAAACRALGHIAGSDAGRAAILATGGAVPAIVSALGDLAGDAEVCEEACVALARIARCSQGAPACATAVTALLGSRVGEARVCRAGSIALCLIASQAEGGCRAACEAAGAVAALDAALCAHAGDVFVSEAACNALGYLFEQCRDPSAAAVPAVVAALANHVSEARVCKAACRALRSFSLAGAAIRAACIGAGAVPAIAAAVAAHADDRGFDFNEAVRPASCRRLFDPRKIIICAESSSWEGKGDVLTSLRGGYKSVGLLGLRVGSSTRGALCSISACDEGAALCASSLLAILGSSEVKALQGACNALWTIAGTSMGRGACVAMGVIPAITALAVANKDKVILFEAACAVLHMLASDTESAPACVASVSTQLGAHAGEAGAVKALFDLLRGIAANPPGRAACASAGALPFIIAALRAHVGAAGVCLSACLLLGVVANSAKGGAFLAAAGAVPAIKDVLENHAGDALVCEAACCALRNVVDAMGGVTGAHLVPLFVGALGLHAGHVGIFSAACSALGCVSRCAGARAACAAAGAAPAIVAALSSILKAWNKGLLQAEYEGGDVAYFRSVMAACYALRRMEGRAALIAAGAVGTLYSLVARAGTDSRDCGAYRALRRIQLPAAEITAALSGHAGDAFVAQVACFELRGLALRHEGRAAAVAAGAVPAVVAALRAHAKEKPYVAKAACNAIENFACSGEGLAACLAAGAVPACVAALLGAHAERGRDRVCEAACHALGRIARSNEGRAACLTAGAAPAVVAPLVPVGAHACDEDLTAAALVALTNFAFRSDEGAAACVAAGAVPAIVASLEAPTAACTALFHIVQCAEGKAACISAGAVPAIVGVSEVSGAALWVLRDVSRSAEGAAACVAALLPTLRYGSHLAALRFVAHTAEGRSAILAADAIPLVISALGGGAGAASAALGGCAEAACAALRDIADSTRGRAACLSAGAAPAVVAALRAGAGGDAGACRAACGALRNFARSAAGRAACLAADAVGALRTAAAAEGPGSHHVRAALYHFAGPPTLALLALPPPQLAERLASCLECWLAEPRRAPCPHGGAQLEPCPICRESAPDVAWTAFSCGHLFHAGCVMAWAASATRGARAAALLPSHTAAHCPMDRSVVTRVVEPGEEAPEGALRVVDAP